jgi:Tol biopolymer transport system component
MWNSRYLVAFALLVIGCKMQGVPTLPDTSNFIAFCRQGKEDNAKSDIWLINIQTKQEMQVTNTSHYYEESPVWLSNSKLVYIIYPQPESYTEIDLVIADFNSGKQRLLDYWTWQNCPSWDKLSVDRDGNIFYSPAGGSMQMLMPSMDMEEYSIREIFSSEMTREYGLLWLHGPSIFPGGNELLFSACDTQQYKRMDIGQNIIYFNIYHYNIHEHTLKQLTFGDARNDYASWIGSDSIVFSSNRDGNMELYLMSPDRIIFKRLTHTDSIEEWQGTISPDHSLFCYDGYNLKTADEEIWVMDLRTGETEYLTNGYEPAWSLAR